MTSLTAKRRRAPGIIEEVLKNDNVRLERPRHARKESRQTSQPQVVSENMRKVAGMRHFASGERAKGPG